jgi:gamma-glutamylcyclotransferase (GGCT)/AIG2-like uncharacterized protein YtfP
MIAEGAPEAMNIPVFVYGSLKTGHGNNRLLSDPNTAQFYETTHIEGQYKLMDMGPYPGLIRSQKYDRAAIVGELYFVSENVLKALDILEGNTFYYTRSKVDVCLPSPVKAWCYFLPVRDARDSTMMSGPVQCWHPSKVETEYMSTLRDTIDKQAA